jgi:hypothetical protein
VKVKWVRVRVIRKLLEHEVRVSVSARIWVRVRVQE